MKTAVFPGSFDPLHMGHVDIIKRALPLFDKIIIAQGINTSKQSYFSEIQKHEWLNKAKNLDSKIQLAEYAGLTVDYCKSVASRFIIRGLRTGADFEYEQAIAQANQKLNSEIETVFLVASPQWSFLSSTIIKDIHKHGGDISLFVL